MMPEPFVDYPIALLALSRDPDSVTDFERQQIEFLISQSTAVIISYCGVDPRADPEQDQDCSVLGFVAARMVTKWFAPLVDQLAGVESETFADVTTRFATDTGIDPLCKQILDRFRIFSIA